MAVETLDDPEQGLALAWRKRREQARLEGERLGCERVVDRPARWAQDEKLLAQVVGIALAPHEPPRLEGRYGARDRRLVHDAVGGDVAGRAHAVLAERGDDAPSRDAEAEALLVDLRQGARDHAREDVEP